MIKVEPELWLDGMRWTDLQRPTRTSVVLSRDGRFMVYSAIAANPDAKAKPQLYLRRIDQSEAKAIAGTEGGVIPFLSPDDRWVGFWADGKLMKVSVDGGVPLMLCNVASLFGASWGLDDRIIFANAESSGLSRVSAEGGAPESLTTPDQTKQEYSHRLPYCLPDGKRVLFTIMGEAFDLHPRTALLDLKTRSWHVLVEDAADARYVPTEHLVFLREGTLMAVPFDLRRGEVLGRPAPVIANVMQALNIGWSPNNTAAGQFSISNSGCLVYAEGGINPDTQTSLVWVDHQGRTEPIAPLKAPFFAPRLSPDGHEIAYTTVQSENQAWVYDLSRGTASRLTSEGKAVFVTWTPEGKRLVFAWEKGASQNLYWQAADGSTAMERLTTSGYDQWPGSWSPDGATLAFVQRIQDKVFDIFLLDLRSRRTTSFLHSGATLWYPEFSPDGRWMAYASDESGRMEVYVRPFPGPGGKWLISRDGGSEPLWARNGKQLFYRWGVTGQEIWAVDIRIDGGLSAGKPRLLFEAPMLISGGVSRAWDLSPNGQRFLMVIRDEVKPVPVIEMVLVVNWFQELQRLAPTAKK